MIWYNTLSVALIEFGLTAAPYDPALFIKKLSSGDIFLVDTHSDDILSVGPDKPREELRKFITGRFNTNPVKVQEDVQHGILLGMVITRDRKLKTIRISQPNLVRTIVGEMDPMDVTENPYLVNFLHHDPDFPPVSAEEHEWFRSKLMKMNFLTRSRIELKFVVAFLATKMAGPNEHNVACLKQVLKYINGTQDFDLLLRPTSLDLMVSIDSSFAIHKKDATSQSGLAISLGPSNVVAGWSHKMKQVNADSTSAELGSLAFHTREVLWWINLLNEIGITQRTVPIQQDNSSTIILSQRGPGTGKSRYLNVNYFFSKEHIDAGVIELVKTESCEMIADGFTKALYGSSWKEFTNLVLNRTTLS
jgi:hypothetical protein